MKGFIFLTVAAVAIATGLAATPYQLCGDPKDPSAKVTGVVVPNCDAAPCNIKKGTNISISITFTTSKAFTSLHNKVYGEIGGIDIPFPGYPDSMVDICKLGVSCPTAAGKTYTEKVELPVATSDPGISVVAKWEIRDGKTTVGCFEVPLKIVS